MNDQRVLKFTHANKQRPINVRAFWVTGFEHDPTLNCTLIHVPGGFYPVKETEEEVERALTNAPGGEEKKDV